MKDIKIITERMICAGQAYKVMMFTATTPEEKKIAHRPWIAVHESYTEKDLPLNGLQMLISADAQELDRRMRFDAAARNFKAAHPDGFTPEELIAWLDENVGPRFNR